MSELKSCTCGCDKINVEEDCTLGIYECSIGCVNPECGRIITKLGYSKANAKEKAVKAWNEKEK